MESPSSSADRDPLERLAAEFLDRRRRGEHPALSEYAERYPQLAEQIREFFPALEVMEGLKPGSGSETGLLLDRADGAGAPLLERLGEYRILREIGRGGMGVVYEAIQESLGRRVALKTLPFHGRIDPVQMERFQLESRSAARLHHTSIVPVHGVGEHLGVHYYVMQYIQGHGLDVILDDLRRLRAGAAAMPASASRGVKDDTGSVAIARSLLIGRFAGSPSSRDVQGHDGPTTDTGPRQVPGASVSSPNPGSQTGGSAISSMLSQPTETSYYRAVARLGVQVAEALAHAHGQGVLHRDIKPSNLLLDVDGQVWITDFGLAKLEGSDGPTHTGDIVGTLRYMAPERFEGWSDRRSDLYGLGMTLYELLTLRPAFEGATRARLIEQVIHDPPAAPRKHDSRIPRDLETIVLKAIAKEPAERYATAEAMSADLRNFLADRPIVARRSGAVETAWRWCRRNKAAAGFLAASMIAVLALVGVVVGVVDNARVRSSRLAAVDARRVAEQAQRAEAVLKEAAVASAEKYRRLDYFHQVALSEREWQGNNPRRAEELLDTCPTDLRGWEWNYLKQVCHSDYLTIRGHTTQVFGVAFSPDGRLIASGATQDRNVMVWDARTLQRLRILDGGGGSVCSVAFSPDGKLLAAGIGNPSQNQPGTVRIWDLETGKDLALSGHVGSIFCVAFSKDSARIASAGEDRTARIWDAKTGERVGLLPSKTLGFTSVTFSPDGKYVALATGNRDEFAPSNIPCEVKIWNAETCKEVHVLKGHAGSVNSLAYSPDGRRLASAGSDKTVRIWDPETGLELYTLRGHTQFVVGVAFSPPDGTRLVSACEDGTLRVWDSGTGEHLFTLWGHDGAVNCVAYGPDGKRVASGGDDMTVKVWDVGKAPISHSLNGAGQGWFTGVAISGDGKRLAAASADQSVTVWDAPTQGTIAILPDHSGPIWGLAFSPDGCFVASCCGEWSRTDPPGEVTVWNLETRRPVLTLTSKVGVIWRVAFSPDGQLIATAGGELQVGPGELRLWDAKSGEPGRVLVDQGVGMRGVTFSPDGKRLASAAHDGLVTVWDRQSGRATFSSRVHGSAEGVAFSRDGEFLAAAGVAAVTIWNVATGEETLLRGHIGQVMQVAFHPDGERVATAGYDGTVKVWDARSGQELLTLRGYRGPVSDVAFSPDGRQILSASRDGTVRIWESTPWVELPPRTSQASGLEKNRDLWRGPNAPGG
jgi:WD40 repeat protein/serine/threonine protein kinase